MTTKEQKEFIHHQTETLINNPSTSKHIKIVAEGDSWFDYPLSKDIIDWLAIEGYAIKNLAKHGDILENIVYGTDIKENIENKTKSLDKTLAAVKKHEPSFVLLSGGGNDVVGENMIQFLNHQSSGMPLLRKKEFTNHVNGYVRSMIKLFCTKIWEVDNNIHILMDGYAYAKANGKAYKKIWINWSGPWILPGMHQKAILSKTDHENIIKEMVDIFNDMLAGLSDELSHFHHIDLRSFFPKDEQWDNEIHLTNEGYRSAASIYHFEMKKINRFIQHDIDQIKVNTNWPADIMA
jgi:hypothetical protein